jgi:hypothetical protein
MKLRMKNNSIRLRLTQSEVAQFAALGVVEETIEFGSTDGECLIYALEKNAAETLSARFENGKITIFVPEAKADEWANSDQIGIEALREIGAGKTLKILIEKDFVCATRRDGEDDADAFPHPEAENSC